MVVHICNFSDREAEAGGLKVQGQQLDHLKIKRTKDVAQG